MPIIAVRSGVSTIVAPAPIPAAASPAPPATTRRKRFCGITGRCSQAVDRPVDELWTGCREACGRVVDTYPRPIPPCWGKVVENPGDYRRDRPVDNARKNGWTACG